MCFLLEINIPNLNTNINTHANDVLMNYRNFWSANECFYTCFIRRRAHHFRLDFNKERIIFSPLEPF